MKGEIFPFFMLQSFARSPFAQILHEILTHANYCVVLNNVSCHKVCSFYAVLIDQCAGTVYCDKGVHDPDEGTRSRRGSHLSHKQVSVTMVTVAMDTVSSMVFTGLFFP